MLLLVTINNLKQYYHNIIYVNWKDGFQNDRYIELKSIKIIFFSNEKVKNGKTF